MATTVGIVNDLFEKTIADVSQDAEHWQSFLKTASMNYTNDFSEQLLIYAQRPTAIALQLHKNYLFQQFQSQRLNLRKFS